MAKYRNRIILMIVLTGLLMLPAKEVFSAEGLFINVVNKEGIAQARQVLEDKDGVITLISNAGDNSPAPQSLTEPVLITIPDKAQTSQFYIDKGFAYASTDKDVYYIENFVKEKEERVELACPVKSYEPLDNNKRHRFLKSLTLEARLGGVPDSNAAIVPAKVLTSTNDDVAGYSELFITETNLPDAMRIHSSIVTTLCSMDGSGATLRGPPMIGVLP